CCLPNGSCSVQDQLVCEAAGGTFGGQGTLCGEVPCCPHGAFAWADHDGDGDVDIDDFGGFQVCYSGSGGGVAAGCACFDRDGDADVDENDLLKFSQCVSGANVPWSPTPECPAQP